MIHIVTRRGHGTPAGSGELSAGRFDHSRALLQAEGTLGAMDYAVSGSYLDNGRPVEGSRFRGDTFHAHLGIDPADETTLRWVLRYTTSRSHAFPDDSGGPAFAVRRAVERRDADELTTGLVFQHTPLPWWEYSLQVGLYSRQERTDSPGVAPGVRDPAGLPPHMTENTFRRTDITVRQLFSAARGVRLAFGVQGQFEDGASTGSVLLGPSSALPTGFRLSRTVWSPFLELQLTPLPGLVVHGGVRVDVPRRFETAASPRVGVAYTLAATHTTVRVNGGEGFKLPSFFALSHPLVGNPDLGPETSHSVDVGVSQDLWGPRFTIGVTYFYSVYRNLVDFEEGPPPRLVNRSRVTAQGVEGSLSARPWPRLRATTHVTYVHTDIQGTAEPLRNRPQWRGGVTVYWGPRPDLDVSLQTVAVGAVPDSSIPTGPRTLAVTACNRNRPGLQSARFLDHINCIYRPAPDHINCN